MPLIYTQRQQTWPVDGKEGIAYYDIDPMEFLRLTTEDDGKLQAVFREAESLDFYNGQPLTVHPFLQVSPSGRVGGHEGRHRAAALVLAGERSYRIAIVGHDYEDWPVETYGWRWRRTLPCPKNLLGQFRPVEHEVDQGRIELIQR